MKKKLCILTLAASAVLTGCTQVPDLSDVDNNVAAQYVADALLRYDKNYDDSLDYDHSVLQPTPTPVPTAAPTPVPSDSSNPGTTGGSQGEVSQTLASVSLSDIYGIQGVNIKAGSYRVTSSYGSDYAVCTASTGKKLVVVNFSVSNTSKKAKKVNLTGKNMQAELRSGSEALARPLMSIVEGDLQYFNERIDAGKKKQGVLIFEVDKSVKLRDVEVRFVSGNKQAVVSVH